MAAEAYCRQALVLALDVSGSVSSLEYQQQISGLAAALRDPEVEQLILAGPGHVSVMAFEWSSENHQSLIADWTTLRSGGDVESFAARVAAHRKIRAGLKTALGRALEFSAAKLRQQADCLRHTIDVSADGKNNIGPQPSDIYQRSSFQEITVNALVVDISQADKGDVIDRFAAKKKLRAYYETRVIRGPGAFAMIAKGYADYAHAMREKLIRELAPPVLGRAALIRP